MAFRSNGPVTLALPAFRGVTRQIILVCVVAFFVFWMLASFVPGAGTWLVVHLTLEPALALHGWVWQWLTYAFFPSDLTGELLALLSLWFFGAALEDQLGSRWLREFFFLSTVGGGVLASVFAAVSQGRLFGISDLARTAGLWPFLMALLLAYAFYNPEQEIVFAFLLRLKAKYLAAIYLLVYLGKAILGNDRFGALTAICAPLAGWLYLRFAPRRGMGFAASETWYGWRNAFYRNKRKRAAKKFQVYMRDQGRDVHFDANGKFVDDERRNPSDRKWMN
jgi:membrane associated rhomboid family serine protease